MRLFTNNALSTLAADITNVATSMAVATGDGALFPNPSAPDDFLATIYTTDANGNITAKEIVQVTARSGDTFGTIVRAQEGTTAQAWTAATAKVGLFMTAGDVDGWMKKVPDGRAKDGTNTMWTKPGVLFTDQPFGTPLQTASMLTYEPFVVVTPITLDRIGIELTVVGTAGALIRLGICKADGNWQPGALVLDAGTVAVDATPAIKAITISTVLQPGRYLAMFQTDASATQATVRAIAGLALANNIYDAFGNFANYVNALRVSRAMAAFPDPAPAATFINGNAGGFAHRVLLRVSVP